MFDLLEPSRVAYASGVMDGEGCIFMASNLGSICLRIAMADKPTILHLHETFQVGRTFSYEHETYSVLWKWEVASSLDTIKVLKIMRPYLIAKSREADLAMEFESMMGRRGIPRTPEMIAARRDLWERLRQAKPSYKFREA